MRTFVSFSIAFVVLLLAACSGGGVADSGSGASSGQAASGGSSVQTAASENYTNASDVIVDAEGKRSFPTMSREQELDVMWESVVRDFEEAGLEAPERPETPLIRELSGSADDAQYYVSCMHEAGWTSVQFVEATGSQDAGYESGDIAVDQYPAYSLADYQCSAQYYNPPVPPRDEAEMEALWEYQVNTVIPCLEKSGVVVDGFPSKEAYVDQYFAERTFVLASDWASADIQNRSVKDPSYECFAYPPDSAYTALIVESQ